MASVATAIAAYGEILAETGRIALSNFYGRDFEVYILALELVDSNDNTVDYMMFPVMPDNISISESERTNIIKTFAGTTVINSTSYVPKDIMIKGKFGRGFKAVTKGFESKTQDSIENGVYSSEDLLTDVPSVKKPGFIPYFKTGYGLIKNLQSIVSKAKSFDNKGKPFKLFLYNPSLGENYLCALKKSPLELSQNESSSNMMWGYALSLKAIANLDYLNIQSRDQLSNFKISAVDKSITATAKLTNKYIQSGASALRGLTGN